MLIFVIVVVALALALTASYVIALSPNLFGAPLGHNVRAWISIASVALGFFTAVALRLELPTGALSIPGQLLILGSAWAIVVTACVALWRKTH